MKRRARAVLDNIGFIGSPISAQKPIGVLVVGSGGTIGAPHFVMRDITHDFAMLPQPDFLDKIKESRIDDERRHRFNHFKMTLHFDNHRVFREHKKLFSYECFKDEYNFIQLKKSNLVKACRDEVVKIWTLYLNDLK